MDFEWDEAKAEANVLKHSVPFDEAQTVFDDRLSTSSYDDRHSDDEERFITVGTSKYGQLLVVVHTYRSGNNRIISARPATRAEKRLFESGATNE